MEKVLKSRTLSTSLSSQRGTTQLSDRTGSFVAWGWQAACAERQAEGRKGCLPHPTPHTWWPRGGKARAGPWSPSLLPWENNFSSRQCPCLLPFHLLLHWCFFWGCYGSDHLFPFYSMKAILPFESNWQNFGKYFFFPSLHCFLARQAKKYQELVWMVFFGHLSCCNFQPAWKEVIGTKFGERALGFCWWSSAHLSCPLACHGSRSQQLL